MDFRNFMCCHDCWAFTRNKSLQFYCSISQDTENRPIDLPPDTIRSRLSPVFEWDNLKKWPCDYRYTKQEVEFIRSGKFHEAHVSKADASRFLEILEQPIEGE